MVVTKLKLRIVELGLKQCNIASTLNIDETLFSKYTTGRRPVPVDVQKKLAKHLKTKQADLFPAE